MKPPSRWQASVPMTDDVSHHVMGTVTIGTNTIHRRGLNRRPDARTHPFLGWTTSGSSAWKYGPGARSARSGGVMRAKCMRDWIVVMLTRPIAGHLLLTRWLVEMHK